MRILSVSDVRVEFALYGEVSCIKQITPPRFCKIKADGGASFNASVSEVLAISGKSPERVLLVCCNPESYALDQVLRSQSFGAAPLEFSFIEAVANEPPDRQSFFVKLRRHYKYVYLKGVFDAQAIKYPANCAVTADGVTLGVVRTYRPLEGANGRILPIEADEPIESLIANTLDSKKICEVVSVTI
jgi:hypothetical protein